MVLANWLQGLMDQFNSQAIRRIPKRRRRKSFVVEAECLEQRILLSGLSVPNQPLAVGTAPLAVEVGLFDQNTSTDVAALNADGTITAALNSGVDTWSSPQTTDLGVGPAYGMAMSVVAGNPMNDLIVQTADSIAFLITDGDGTFSLHDTVTPGPAGALAPVTADRVQLAATLLNSDFSGDLAVVAPGTNELLVFFGDGTGHFGTAERYATGGIEPVALVAANLIGDLSPDLAVGHRDGSLTFFEGRPDGNFTRRDDLTVTGLKAIDSLAAADWDGDGENDLVVTAGDHATLLVNDADELPSSPIVNGDFLNGLTGWTPEIVGHAPDSTPGSIDALSGRARLTENASFLISLKQTFTVPSSPQTLTLDILSLGLEDAGGGIPDAFEISLLDESGHSLVPTFRPEATSFFNASAGAISTASGVTWDGRTVTLDLSALPAGTNATLYVDLVGNSPGQTSSVVIDDVRVTPDTILTETFTATPLPGPFQGASGVRIGDVDGDGELDLVIADSAADLVAVIRDDGAGGFTRQDIDVSAHGTAPMAVALGLLTSGDEARDIAVALSDSDLVLTPLAVDTTPPDVALLSPQPGMPTSDSVTEIRVQFSEAMRDGGASADHSVTNPNAYQLTFAGPNGVFEGGTGDDVIVSFTTATYDPATNEVVLTVDPAVLPLADGDYRFHIEGDDPALALLDAAGNPLAGGEDVEFPFTINSDGPRDVVAQDVSANEGQSVELNASFADPGGSGPYAAVIDWGDGTSSSGDVLFNAGSGTVTATHTYADNGVYSIAIEITDPGGVMGSGSAAATIANVAPTLTSSGDVTVDRTVTLDQVLATFTDPGFDRSSAGTTETFQATIDWGDGTIDAGMVSVTPGSEGVETTGTVRGTHAYLAAGAFAVAITLTDDDGGTISTNVNVTVNPTAPILDPLPTVSGNEGQEILFEGTFQASELGSPLTATVDWGDGTTSTAAVTFDAGSGTLSATHVYADDGAYNVEVTLANGFAESTTRSTSATIANVAPDVTPAADRTVTEDDILSAVLATFTDPGFDSLSAETREEFTATVDWGDGTPAVEADVLVVPGSPGQPTTGSVSGTHVYEDPGIYTVTVTVDDHDGGVTTVTLEVTVEPSNVAPTILTAPNITGDEGSAVTFLATFTDNEVDLTGHTVEIDWGDGSTGNGTIVIETSGSATITADHIYADNGQYPILLSVTDPLGLSDSATATATIANVAPTLIMSADRELLAGGSQILVPATFEDSGFTSAAAGTSETFTATIDWGDGSPVETAVVDVTPGAAGVPTVGTISGTHAYPLLGTFTVTVTLQDDDGAEVSGTVTLTTTGKFFVVDQSDHSFFKYDPDFNLLQHQDLGQYNSSPRGADTNPTGDRYWVVDSSRNVFVYDRDGALLGSWKTLDATQPQGIATDGTHIWIVGVAKDAIYYYENGASFLSGQYTADAEFDVAPTSNKSSGIVTDGTKFWVTDEEPSNPQMFVYGLDGTVLGTWQLDADNTDPSGVALDPTTGDLWVSDRHDGAVYRYAEAASRLTGNQPADGVFILDAANQDPEGLVDPVELIGLDESISDAISTPGEIDDWQFNAVAGQSIYVDFDALSNGILFTTLLAPDGSTIYSDASSLATSLDNGPFELAQTGVYTLRVNSSSTATPTYQFTIWDVPAPDVGSLSLGDQRSGAIEVPGAVDVWTFTAPADQWIYLDFQQWTQGNVHLTLADPSGNPVHTDFGSFNGLDNGPLQLPATGEYTLTLDGSTDHTPAYQFQLFDANPDVTTIGFNDPVAGAIDNPGDKDIWLFEGTAGHGLFVDWLTTSDTTEWRLYSPSGTPLGSRANFLASQLDGGPFDLTESGTYRIEVTGLFGDLPSYTFQLIDIPAPDVETMAIGETVSGAIEVLGSEDHWHFDGSANQSIYLDFHFVDDGTAEYFLRSPSGVLVATAANQVPVGLDQGPIELPESGTYLLEIVGKFASTPTYGFTLWNVPDPDVTAYTLNDIAYGHIETPGVRDEWTFQGHTGQNVFVDAQNIDDGTLRLQLLAPDGTPVFTGANFIPRLVDSGVLTLPEDGQYTLVATGVGDDVPAYRFRLWDLPAAPPVAIALDEIVTGVLERPGETDRYEFQGTAGQSIQLDVLFNPSNSSGSLVGYTLRDSADNVIFENVGGDQTLTLSATGTYTITVDQGPDQNSDTTGHYSFRVVDTAAIPPLPDAANLVVSDVSVPAFLIANPATLEVTWTTTNTGAATAAGGWTDRVYLSIDRGFQSTIDEIVVEFPHNDPLGAGASRTQSAIISLPDDFEGDVTVIVQTDALGEVFENQDEVDNVAIPSPTAVYTNPLVSGPPAISFDQQNGDQFPAGTDLVLSGQATPLAGTANLIFAVDVSGSTAGVTGLDANFDGVVDANDDLNQDGRVGDIADAEIGGLLRVVQNLRDQGLSARVAIVAFGSSGDPLDLGPQPFWQSFVDPFADRDGDGVFDVDQAALTIHEAGADLFKSVSAGIGTNFTAALEQIDSLMQRAIPAERNQVLFFTDGLATAPPASLLEQLAARGIEFHGFQITGTDVTDQLQFIADTIDAEPNSTGQTTLVADPNDLATALLAGAQIEQVTVDGVPVDVLDAAGHFFHTVNLQPGDNTLTVTAFDSGGHSNTSTITLVGVDPAAPVDFGNLDDVTLLADLIYGGATFNRATGVLHTEVRLVNQADASLDPPVLAIFENISPAAVELANPNGQHPETDRPYVNFDGEIAPGGLAPSATSDPIALEFRNPERLRFDLETALYVQANRQPFFTSTPITTADVGVLYSDTITADDPDGQTLNIALLMSPYGMQLNLATGELTWTPAADQVGLHDVQYRVSDGHGGEVTRQFQIFVGTPPADHPPVFQTEPTTLIATQLEEFSYPALAIDPEGFAVTYQLEIAPGGATVTDGEIRWTPSSSDLGPRVFALRATDPQGNASFQTFVLDVREPNTPPTFESDPVLTAPAGGIYRYDADAVDSEDALTYSLVVAPAGMEITPNTGVITWQAPLAAGTEDVTVRATDERGLFTEQSFTITINPDEAPPVVSILATNSLLNAGETVDVEVRATDDVGVASLTLTADGVPVSLDAFGVGQITVASSGLIELIATAIDDAGNVGTATHTLRVFDPADVTPPAITIDSPQPGDLVTYLTDITGSVTDPNLEFYEIAVAPTGSGQFTTVFTGTEEVVDATLGTFDPTLLSNDRYDVRITAQDVNGQQSIHEFVLDVTGNAKIGNFRLEFTDLAIPLAGIPITINRIYDTLDAKHQGDFGYGWTLGEYDAQIRETVRQNPLEPLVGSIFGSFPFRIGTRVYMNTPDGDRAGFTFDPIPEPGLLGTAFRPRFTPDPGVYEQLEVEDIPLRQLSDGSFVLYFGGFNYNPSEYTLVTKDQLRYRYDQFGGLLDITDRNGVTVSYTDIGIFSSTGQSITWTRDDLGRITEITDPAGNAINYDYNAAGNLTSVTDQEGHITTYRYLNDPAHYLQEMLDPLGNREFFAEFNEAGQLIGASDALGFGLTQTYDLANNREVIANPLGHETTLVYDDRGNILEEIDPLGNSTIRTYDDHDNELTVTDRRGFTTTFTYDDRGNVTSVTDALGGVTLFTYNEFNQLRKMTDPLLRVTENVYDSNGNLIETIDAAGFRQTFTHDVEGRILTQTNDAGHTTEFVYGAGPNPIQIINPDLSARTMTYNVFGDLVHVSDELVRDTFITYNDIGVPLSLKDPLGGVTLFDFDASGQLRSFTDPVGNVTQYDYDDAGHLIRETDPLGQSTLYDYDAAGRLTRITDRNGRVTEYGYDAVGNRTSERWFDAGILIREALFTHDEIGNILTASDPDSSYTFTYDELNRVEKDDNLGTPGVPNLALTYTYDAVGNVLTTSDNYGVTVTSTYDERDLLESRTWQGGGIDAARVEFDYDPRRLRTETRRYADATGSILISRSTQSYDELDRLRSLDHRDGAGALIADYAWDFDAAGQLIEQTDHGVTSTYTYDDFGQLTGVTRSDGTSETYNYDLNGNRTDSHLHGAGYVTGDGNQLLSDGTFNYDYDAEGNLVKKTEIATGEFVEYEYDHRNRMVAAITYSAGGIILQEVDFTYDVFDRRIAKTVDADGAGPQVAETKLFTYDGLHTWADFDGSGSISAWYLYGGDVDELIARWRPSDGTAWYLTDHLGSVRAILSGSGAASNRIDYDSCGNVVNETHPLVGDRFKFTGREWDSELALYYLRARFYDARSGRFASEDPIRFAGQDWNLFRYVGNAPMSRRDPLGLAPITEERVLELKANPSQIKALTNPERVQAAKIATEHIQRLASLQETAGQAALPEIQATIRAWQEFIKLLFAI